MIGPVKFNLKRVLLKGEALQHFNNKAKELENETNAHHAECINAVSRHIFPKNTLQMQKCYLQKVCLCNLTTNRKYFVHWHQQNDYLALFPPYGRVAQKISDDEIIELIYKNLPNHMKSNLKCMNDFNINNTDMAQFHNVLECLKLSYQLEKKLEKKKVSDTSKKDSENPMVSILERRMPIPLTNCSLSWPRRLPVMMKLMKWWLKGSVKKSVKKIFQTHMKTLKKCNCKDTNSNSDLEHQNYHMKDVG